ncbi:hypothetical protein M501DRAFT_1060909 [Patellaria atrata CBS 101060]|uniref:FAD-binding FR-type domain-containing protein n=1 Tax=Patellaria atrata CBS 101060 TaxID=1346257 RepID=A0A9P4VLC1_9PEZI|nr:hypothetical protein M501DRAFT_1060909 [Patellaria atrata CBS 101060]
MDENTKVLTDREINEFLDELDRDKNGYVDYWEVEKKLDEVHQEIAPKAKKHNLHHESRTEQRHRFLRGVLGTNEDRIPREEFVKSVRNWKIPSMEQEKKDAKEQDAYLKRMTIVQRFRAYWEVHGPEIGFLALVISLEFAFGIWQLVKYLTTPGYREALGWGVVLAKTCAGALCPTLFLLVISMSRWLATGLRKFYFISRFVNWDLSQSFHIKLSIATLALASLHAIGHLTGSFLYGSRPAQQDNVADLLGPDAVPRPYIRYVRSLPGYTGLTVFGLFWILGALSLPQVRKWNYEVFQLGHLLMFPIFGLLMAHGTAGLLQYPMLGFWLALPVLLVVIERSLRVVSGFRRICAKLEILDEETLCISVNIPHTWVWPYKAGQYIFLQVPNVSFFQWHPFTISTCNSKRMQVHIKTEGNWTNKLRSLGTEGQVVDIAVGIDGPFGAPAQRFYDFQQAIIVGAGIGVTPFSGILTDLQERDVENCEDATSAVKSSESLNSRENEKLATDEDKEVDLASHDLSKYRRVDFHWMVRDKNNLLWFSDLLNYMSKFSCFTSSSHSNLDVRIQTHVTQTRKQLSTHIFRWLLETHRTEEQPESPLTGLINPTHFGRPDIQKIMDDHYEDMLELLKAKKKQFCKDEGKMEDLEDGMKVGVFFCGAPVIGYQLADRCRALTARGREDDSRIEYHFMMEVFG